MKIKLLSTLKAILIVLRFSKYTRTVATLEVTHP